MKTHIALILILSLFLGSCVTQRKCAAKFPLQSSRDSIYIENVKEIPIYLKGDTIKVDVPVNCPDQDIVFMENSKLRQQIRILNGRIISNTHIKPDTIKVNVTEIKTVVKEIKVPAPVKFIPKIYKIAFWGWIFVIVTTAGYFALKIFVFRK